MSAELRCGHCRRHVMAVDPRTFGVPGVPSILADAWEEHVAECTRTCPWCRGTKEDGRRPSCGAPACTAAASAQRVLDRIEDVETLMMRTSDGDWIARQVGLTNAGRLREWLRNHGRRDLADTLQVAA